MASEQIETAPAELQIDRCRRFLPRFRGELRLDHVPEDFADRIIRRVQDGFLKAGSRQRANYIATQLGNDGVRVTANDLWSAINVGLNEVTVRLQGPNSLRYDVAFWTWTKCAAALCGAIFALVVILFAVVYWAGGTVALRNWGFDSEPRMIVSSMSIAAFFGLLWPWILTEMHKKPAARCLERILCEALGSRRWPEPR